MLRRSLSKRPKNVFKTNYPLKQVKLLQNAPMDSATLSTFIMLPFVITIFVLSIFEWPFYTGFNVIKKQQNLHCVQAREIKS